MILSFWHEDNLIALDDNHLTCLVETVVIKTIMHFLLDIDFVTIYIYMMCVY